jgi:hypothetical protein
MHPHGLTADDQGSSVTAELHFLARSDEYNETKPYSMRFAPNNGIPQSIIKNETRMTKIRDMRTCQEELNFQSCGFGIMPFTTRMRYEDFEDSDAIRSIYMEELKTMLEDVFHASYVYVIDNVVWLDAVD